MIEVKKTKTMGRGVFATQDIPANTTIHLADYIKVPEEEVNNTPTFAKYVFQYSKKYSALSLGVGSLFNHSDNPNAEVCFSKVGEREVMEFYSVKDIKAGEQIFISYGGEDYAYYHLLKKKS